MGELGRTTEGHALWKQHEGKHDCPDGDPREPNKYQKCSKRSWDAQIRKWRNHLHWFDKLGSKEAQEDDNPQTFLEDSEREKLRQMKKAIAEKKEERKLQRLCGTHVPEPPVEKSQQLRQSPRRRCNQRDLRNTCRLLRTSYHTCSLECYITGKRRLTFPQPSVARGLLRLLLL
eukprot:NODE_1189_length_651_cov_562.493355_g932_i0.p1 GENE.NODE_1189_length_651_cov_562.493355_g932_i0~~NODE_1189_length_651_cov_562.493355_g932_i0.p1  ORF type:complete len:174 (-),score=30.59 NODE_1189_length_651_cov_562.493355_g932_i0:102-623(-)